MWRISSKDHHAHDAKSSRKLIQKKTKEMKKAAADLEFERAAEIRDTISALKDRLIVYGDPELG